MDSLAAPQGRHRTIRANAAWSRNRHAFQQLPQTPLERDKVNASRMRRAEFCPIRLSISGSRMRLSSLAA